MPIKLIMSWDITPQREQEYFEFVVREFIPGIQDMGFELSDAWATIYGSQPQILVGALIPSFHEAKNIMKSKEWGSLNNKLQDFVHNYSFKIVEARGGFQF